ncbi:MAG TPA: hypothetical protein DDY13_17385 [Cytophagales bacterium]|nr:hypothetical protein [Cytophagales bacterium]
MHYYFSGLYRKCFFNLISNSIKYRSDNRRLKLQIRINENDNIHQSKISDNGLGIDLISNKKELFVLYQRFHDHVDGKGFGLYLKKTQTEALGGDINLSSEPDKGATFELHIPDSKSTN